MTNNLLYSRPHYFDPLFTMHARVSVAFGIFVSVVLIGYSGLILLMIASQGIGQASSLAMFFEMLYPVLQFSVLQASLSTLISFLFGILIARAVFYCEFRWLRTFLVNMLSLIMLMPTTIAVLGLLMIWGRSGWINNVVGIFGSDGIDIYGMPGVVFVHVFFNASLIARLTMHSFELISDTQWRLSQLMGFRDVSMFWHMEWPVIRKSIPGICTLVFILCFTSFSVVLMLGARPDQATLEVAIYRAIVFDFDLIQASLLGLFQFMFCAAVYFILFRLMPLNQLAVQSTITAIKAPAYSSLPGKWLNRTIIMVTLLLLLSPVSGIIVKSFDGKGWAVISESKLWWALFNSIVVALLSGALAVFTSYVLGLSQYQLNCRLYFQTAQRQKDGNINLSSVFKTRLQLSMLGFSALQFLATPPLLFGLGTFLLILPIANPTGFAPFVIILSNMLLALPFCTFTIVPTFQDVREKQETLAQSIGIKGWQRFRQLEFPMIRNSMGFAMGLAVALSLGDLGVVALFGGENFTTLPWLMYQLMGRYRHSEAALVAVILILLCLALYNFFTFLFRRDINA